MHPETPISIAFISSSGEEYGAEGVMLGLIESLGPGWVDQVIFLRDGPAVERVRAMGHAVTVTEGRQRAGLALTARDVRRILSRSDADVVHANHFRAAAVAAAATAGTATPFVWQKHDSTRDGRLGQFVARRSALVAGVSESVNEAFTGSVRGRLRVVYPGVPAPVVDRAAGRDLAERLTGTGEEDEIIALVGRLSPQKGQLDLLEVAPRLVAERPRLHLAFLGSEIWPYEGYEQMLRDRAAELGVDGSVTFAGQLPAGDGSGDDVARFVTGCDVLVAPSRREPESGWREGFGLAPIEAMSVETPVVAYRHGSFPEVLGDCALLVEEGDTGGLAEAITRVLADGDLRERMTACGVERARRYRPEATVEAMKLVYLEAAGISTTPKPPS